MCYAECQRQCREFKELLGKTISEVVINKGNDLLMFACLKRHVHKDTEKVLYEAYMYASYMYATYGECCSNSYFYEINGIDNLQSPILSIVELDMPDMPGPVDKDGYSRCDVISQYGFKFTTSKGICEIIFRNESNGYYCGHITRASDDQIEHFFKDWNGPKLETFAITKDWNIDIKK